MKSNTIRDTLYRKLIQAPSPIGRMKSIFHKTKKNCFPGLNEYEAFLLEQNYEKKEDIAKKILLRLAYETPFSPATKVLFNLYYFENEIALEEKGPYIPRDHFVHLVNLYLLGIYMFFYHEALNKQLVDYFKKSHRLNDDLSNSEISIESCKCFIITWQYFVLNHDLGYPLEYLNTSDLNPNREKFINVFENIQEYLAKDIALKQYSQILLFGKIIESPSDIFKQKDLTYLTRPLKIWVSDKKIWEEYPINKFNDFESISNACFLDKVNGITALNTVLNFVEKNKIIATLCSESEDTPLFFLIPNSDTGIHEIFHTEFYKNKNKNFDPEKLIEEAFVNKNYIGGYRWNYYLTEKNNLYIKELNKFFKDGGQIDTYQRTSDYFFQNANFDFSLITDDDLFSEFSYQLYYSIFHSVGLSADNPNKKQIINQAEDIIIPIIKDYTSKLPGLLGDIFTDILKSNSSNVNETISVSLNESIKNLIQKSVPDLNALIIKLNAKVELNVQNEIELKYLLTKSWETIYKNLATKQESIAINFRDNNEYQKYEVFSELYNTEHWKKFNDKIIENNLTWECFTTYKPVFSQGFNIFYDHGIASALISLITEDCYVKFQDLNLLIPNIMNNSIGFKISNIKLTEKNLHAHFRKNLLANAQLAISLHNLYLKDFNDNRYKTSLKSNPFAFFSILCDSLQPWDRKRLINQAIKHLPYNTYGNKFNLTINKITIEIHEEGDGIDMKERINALRTYLDDYLENASKIIKLSFSEF